MAKVKNWLMDEQEKALEEYLAQHPNATPEEAHAAVIGEPRDG